MSPFLAGRWTSWSPVAATPLSVSAAWFLAISLFKDTSSMLGCVLMLLLAEVTQETCASTTRNALLVAGAFSRPSGGHFQRAADLYESTARSHGSMVRVCANTVSLTMFNIIGTIFKPKRLPYVRLKSTFWK